ncbi:hypothetical protein ACFY5K_25620 [Streptomyces griseofuscus]|uniref:hypothetical protein n=1 Tax=Streptomyces griseofuscus TaxID=146922 RepID=UPI0036B0E5C8
MKAPIEEYNEKQKAGLQALIRRYPFKVSKGEGLHLSTAKSLERLDLVTVEKWWDREWRGGMQPHGPLTEMWSAELTPKGIQEALKLGYATHEPGRCMLPSECPMHTEGHPAPVPVPTLEREPDVQEGIPGIVLPEDPEGAAMVAEAFHNRFAGRSTPRLEDIPGILKGGENE